MLELHGITPSMSRRANWYDNAHMESFWGTLKPGLISRRLRREFTASLLSKLVALLARPVLSRVSASLDPRAFNGAVMVGLKHIVVKSHGSADRVAMARAIAIAATAVRRRLIEHVTVALDNGATPQGQGDPPA